MTKRQEGMNVLYSMRHCALKEPEAGIAWENSPTGGNREGERERLRKQSTHVFLRVYGAHPRNVAYIKILRSYIRPCIRPMW
jgi:hypothetical protein